MNKRIASAVLKEGVYDILQLAEVVSLVRTQQGESEDRDLKSAVAHLICEFVGRGSAVVGDAQSVEGLLQVVSWDSVPEQTASRVLEEWTALGRNPELGEVCWLALTEVGRTVAEATP